MASPQKYQDLSGLEKAAIFLFSIEEDLASEIFRNLNKNEIQAITSAIKSIESISPEIIREVMKEFKSRMDVGMSLNVPTTDYLKKILQKTHPEDVVEEIMAAVESGITIGSGIDALQWLDPQSIASFLKNEHPQTCAVILANVNPDMAAKVIGLLPEKNRSDIVLRMANLERIAPEIIQEINEVIEKELISVGAAKSKKIGGIETVAGILNQMERAVETDIMNSIEDMNPNLAETIRNKMFIFEDLINVDDRGMQSILKEITNDILVIALKTASKEMKEKIFRCISERAAKMLQEELQFMGPTKLQDVERAQQDIIKIARRLEDEGKIVIAGKGGGEVLV